MKSFYEPMRSTSPFQQFEIANLTVTQQMAKEQRQQQWEQLDTVANDYLIGLLAQHFVNQKQNVFVGQVEGIIYGTEVQNISNAEQMQRGRFLLAELKAIVLFEDGETLSDRPNKYEDWETKRKYSVEYAALRGIRRDCSVNEPLEVIDLIKRRQQEQD